MIKHLFSLFAKNGKYAFFVVVLTVQSTQVHASTHSKKVTVWGWGGPETDLRCDAYVDWGLLGKHCRAHSVFWVGVYCGVHIPQKPPFWRRIHA